MNIALAVLLLVLGGLTLWLLSESSLKWYFKSICITIFCSFTVVFWSATHSYLGWPARAKDMPEKVLIHWVIVKEPNNFDGYDGNIYFLIESAEKQSNNIIVRFFGYKKDRIEPRLFELPYSRELHEQVENQMRKKMQSGQPVMGEFKKKDGKNGQKGKKGGDGKNTKKGGGSESQAQQWEFHELRPSDFLEKPQ